MSLDDGRVRPAPSPPKSSAGDDSDDAEAAAAADVAAAAAVAAAAGLVKPLNDTPESAEWTLRRWRPPAKETDRRVSDRGGGGGGRAGGGGSRHLSKV